LATLNAGNRWWYGLVIYVETEDMRPISVEGAARFVNRAGNELVGSEDFSRDALLLIALRHSP
jgi:hypothetical protein